MSNTENTHHCRGLMWCLPKAAKVLSVFQTRWGESDHLTELSGIYCQTKVRDGRPLKSHSCSAVGWSPSPGRPATPGCLPPPWTEPPRFLASTPAELPSAGTASSEPAHAHIRVPALGRVLTEQNTANPTPHPWKKLGSLRLLVSIRLKAGVPAKVATASGYHNLALTEERGTGVSLGLEEMHQKEGSGQFMNLVKSYLLKTDCFKGSTVPAYIC